MSQLPPPPPVPPPASQSPPRPPPQHQQHGAAPLNYVSHGRVRPTNPLAVVSLVCGLLLCVPWVPSILAASLGKVALGKSKELGGVGRGPANAGLILGLAGIGLWVVLSLASVPAMLKARQQARRVQCMSNLRQLGVAGIMYTNDNSGHVAPDLASLGPYLGTGARQICTCPAAAHNKVQPAHVDALGTYSYLYLKPAGRFSHLRNASSLVMIYEPPENHAGTGFGAVYWDGHVEWHELPKDGALLKQLEAQRNAPPPAGETVTPIGQ